MSARPWLIVAGVIVGLLLFARRAQAAALDATGAIAPNDRIARFGNAIAIAEGYGNVGAVPTRANNPGDLKAGPPAINGITVFDSPADGWRALYAQLQAISDGRSGYYWPQMTIAEMAVTYAGSKGAPAWAANVSRSLGVPMTTAIGDLL